MSLSDLTDPAAIRAAIAEFDSIGRDAFLARYGFGPSREYVLRSDGREYDSKAIVGAAHGFQHPELGPLASADFSGGDQTIAKLRQFGFEVHRAGEASQSNLGAVLADFLARYAAAKSDPFQGGHEAALLLKEAATLLEHSLPAALARARVRASVGQGNWAAVPWIAVLDPRVTTTTQHGVYPVVLVREDLSGLYLTIAQGVTSLKNDYGTRGAYEVLRERAERLRPLLASLEAEGFDVNGGIDLGSTPLARDYAASTVASKFYAVEDLPTSPVSADHTALADAYARLVDSGAVLTEADEIASADPRVLSIYVGAAAQTNFESGGRRGWWGWKHAPAAEVADVRVGDLIIFGSGFSGGSPRVDAGPWQQQRLAQLVIGRIDRPPFASDEAVMPDEQAGLARYPWKVRFSILGEERDVALSPGTALGAGTVEALRKSAIAAGRGGVSMVEGSPLLERYVGGTPASTARTTPEELATLTAGFLASVRESGMSVDEQQVRCFVAGLLAKPFAILTGQSGSGKTQLAKRLGEWCGQDQAGRNRYKIVPVRPDWTGPEFLFGYVDALAPRTDGGVVWSVPETLEFILRAHADPGAPYVLVLDEMNLAHVERYFADFLSGIESRDDLLPALRYDGHAWVQRDTEERLPLPANLLVVGTVNVDETTYMFSPKVLDRAFVHEFRVHADQLDPALRRPAPISQAEQAELEGVVRLLQDDLWHFDHTHEQQAVLVDELRALHRHLGNIGADFGHRVFYESLRFAAFAQAIGLSDADEVLDLVVMTKLLPKINGSRQRLEVTLLALKEWAVGPAGDAPQRPRTYAKLERMLAVLRDAQFVTFTE